MTDNDRKRKRTSKKGSRTKPQFIGPINLRFSELLKSIRDRHDYSRGELAYKLGYNEKGSTLANYENRERDVTGAAIDLIDQILKHIDLTEDEILNLLDLRLDIMRRRLLVESIDVKLESLSKVKPEQTRKLFVGEQVEFARYDKSTDLSQRLIEIEARLAAAIVSLRMKRMHLVTRTRAGELIVKDIEDAFNLLESDLSVTLYLLHQKNMAMSPEP